MKAAIILSLLLACGVVSAQNCFPTSSSTSFATASQPALLASRVVGAPLTPTSDASNQFQTGSYSLVNNGLKNRYNYFNLSLSYTPPSSYDVAVSIRNISGYSPVNGLDFSVRASKRPTLLQCVFIIDSAATWTSAQIYFLVSSRMDFQVGTFVANSADLLLLNAQPTNNSIHFHLPHNWTASLSDIFAVPFISGLTSLDNTIDLTFTLAVFNSSTNILTINFISKEVSQPIENLYLSYLVYTLGSQLQVTSIVDLNSIPAGVNTFAGVSSIKSTFSKAGGSSAFALPSLRTTSLLGAPVLVKNTFDEIFNVNGFVIVKDEQTSNGASLSLAMNPNSQLTLDQSLSRAESQAIPAISNTLQPQVTQCVSTPQCNALGGVIKGTQNSVFNLQVQCIICSKNSTYSPSDNICKCNTGYQITNGTCQQVKQQQCTNNFNYNPATKTCECPAIQAAIVNGVCVFCQTGQFAFQGKCFNVIFVNPSGTQTSTATSGSSVPIGTNPPITIPPLTLTFTPTPSNSGTIQIKQN